MKKITLLVLAICASITLNAQTADEILTTYFENIGGLENLKKVEGVKMIGNIQAQGMKIPIETVSMKDGRMYFQMDLQGKTIKQVFSNGEKVWIYNMMDQSTQEMPVDETKMMIDELKDFPNSFINYKEKGYTVELMGKETQDGTECYKIKLTKKPRIIEEKEIPNVTFYYFDTEAFVPILTEAEVPSGPAKGQTMKIPLSDYQEVDGIYFPFTTKIQGMPITYTKIEINPQISDADFAKPAEDKK
ncbi:MAG: outer membrane lipoprotein-sorting protein [Flavobacteriaceae bacterium]|nr:outer membrane lipoprotein-sorting protein [Flavobacteriaceae bacterium]